MEAAVTMAMAFAIVFAAVMMQVLITRSFTSARRVSDLADRATAVSAFLAKELVTVGGNAAGTASSIYVEQECAARGEFPACPRGADRLTLFSAVPKLPACRISHVDNSVTPPRVSFWFRDSANNPKCCFNDEKNGSRVPVPVALQNDPLQFSQYLKQHAMVVQGPFHKGILLIADAAAPGETTAPAPNGYSDNDWDDDGFADTRCSFRMIDVMQPAERFEPPAVADWRNGTVTIADMRTIYLDDAKNPPELVMHTDLDENGAGANPTLSNAGTPAAYGWSDALLVPDTELLTIMDGVYDFQVAIGYDLNDDGDVASSEWTFETPGETRDYRQDRRIRLLRADAVLGVRVSGLFSGSAARSPANGVGIGGLPAGTIAVPGVALRTATVTVMPRNTDSLIAGVD